MTTGSKFQLAHELSKLTYAEMMAVASAISDKLSGSITIEDGTGYVMDDNMARILAAWAHETIKEQASG